jgi:hypothetical protein
MIDERLSDLEAAYYPQWMSLTGESPTTRVWSKRRAMFWGLLVATSAADGYLCGERMAARIGRPVSPPWPKSLDPEAWFLRKAAIANLFVVEKYAGGYRVEGRPDEVWSGLLIHLAQAMLGAASADGLPDNLPARGRVEADRVAAMAAAERLFGAAALPALRDVIDDNIPDAAEFRFALLRENAGDAYFWYQREWSFRAKERYRQEVVGRQGGKCACCGVSGTVLELNHVQKVREFGRTVADNLEGLCKPCHTSIDKRGVRCHSSTSVVTA